MSFLNASAARLVDGLLSPFQDRSPLLSLTFLSLMTAVAMLGIVLATSDQARLTSVKRAIHACLFEMRLFNDDLYAMLRAQREMLGHSLTYLRLSLVPAAWMIVPFGLMVGQLQFHYAYDGLRAGQPALVEVRAHGSQAAPPILEAPAGIRIETPGVSIPSLGETVWRISADRPGEYQLKIHVGEDSFTKSVRVSGSLARRSPVRAKDSFVAQLRFPAERPLPAGGPLESIEITYPRREITVFGRDMHWMVAFLGLSMLFALALRRPFGVML